MMCGGAPLWIMSNANLIAGFLGVIGSILLVIPSFFGSGLKEEALQIEKMKAELTEPELAEPLVVNTLVKSIAFIHREQRWLRCGALCLLASFLIMSLDAACRS